MTRIDEDFEIECSISKNEQTDPLHEKQNTEKFVHPWWKADVLETHPEAKTETASKKIASQDSTQTQIPGIWVWNWIKSFFSSDEVEKTPQKSAEQKEIKEIITTETDQQSFHPEQLSKYEKMVQNAREILRRIKEYNEEMGDELAFEKILAAIYRNRITEQEEEAHSKWENVQTILSQKKALNKDREAVITKMLTKESSASLWNGISKAANLTGVIATGVVVSSNPVSIAMFLAGVGLAADNVMDDWTKKQIAGLISDDTEVQGKYTQAMQVGAGIASIALIGGTGLSSAEGAQKLQSGIMYGINTAVNVTQGSSTIASATARHQGNLHGADMKEINDKIDRKSEDLKKETGRMKTLVDEVQRYYKNLSEIQRTQLQVAVGMIRK